MSLRAARVAGGGARAPAPPGRVSAKRLRDIFASACVDFDKEKKRSNAFTLALPQWRRLCLGSGFVGRKFPASAADVVFAKTRRAGEKELRAEDFASALACVAAETGKTFESVVDDAAKCAAGSGLFVGVAAATRAEPTFRAPRNGVRASSSFSRTAGGSKPKPMPVKQRQIVSTRESFPPARPNRVSAAAEREPSSQTLLDAALSKPRLEDFDAGDVDGDGLLSPGELAFVLMRSCHADETEALELVRVCFEDVDLDKDGRVCFEEYRAFCKKAKRVLRRRALTAQEKTTNTRGSFGTEVRRLTFGVGFASARTDSRETKPKPNISRPASARLAERSREDALGNAKAPRPASARAAGAFLSRSFSEAPSRDRASARWSLNVAEESGASASFAEDSTLDLTPMDLTSMDLTVDDAFIAEKDEPPERGGSKTRDLEPVAEALETDEERRGGDDDAGDEEDVPKKSFSILTEDATNERLAVWRAEFDAHDARGTGRLDLELATFALAKLRLLEDLDVSLAARTLETRLAETAGGENEVALDFEAFARFATALETARLTQKRSNPEAKIAQPVPVRKEYALDDAHPFHKLFREMADSRGEMDGETFACVLRAARLTDDARLTDTGVDVVFARARARHQAERTARRVPYRIFLGALSLAAGHLGVAFEPAAARVAAGAEAARARAAARAGNAVRDEPPHGKENALASPSPSSGGRGKKAPGEKKRSRLSAVFGGRA